MSLPAPTPAPLPGEAEFRIVSQTFDTWNVQFRIEVAELLDQQGLLRHLRRVKQRLAKMYMLPVACMQFDGIIRKTRTDDYVDVVVCIRKELFEKGEPKIRFKEGLGADGTRYARMSALLDLCFLDPFEKPVTPERIQRAIREAAIVPELLDQEIIARKLQEVLEKHLPVQGIPIAKGQFPDLGQDAELEFFFQAVAEPNQTDHYYSSRKVSRGDLLCRKTPPRPGRLPGRNVCGEPLPLRAGLDIALKPGPGAALSLEENEIVADADGVVVVNRTLRRVKLVSGTKELPESITIKVNPVLRVQGDRVLDISSSQSVEVIGNLMMGSRILTDCEVYVSGNVDEGTLIQAADDVTIEGHVHGATVASDASIITHADVDGATLLARDKILIKGTVRNSMLTGESVAADTLIGSRVVARSEVTLARVNADEGNILSTICVGMFDFFKLRIRENEQFIERARQNLTRIEMLVGSDLLAQITTSNIQTMLMRFLAKQHLGQDTAARKQIDVFRTLIESVPPTRALLAQKTQENLQLLQKLSDGEGQSGGVIHIREKIAARTVLSVDGVEAEVGGIGTAADVRADREGNLVLEPRRSAMPAGGPPG